MIKLRTQPPVPKEIRREARNIVRTLPSLVEIRHDLIIYVVPSEQWVDEDKCRWVTGQFRQPYSGEPPVIVAGGLVWDYCLNEWKSGEGAIREFRDTMFHEIAHYLQFRDGVPVVERGIKKRTKELIQLYERSL